MGDRKIIAVLFGLMLLLVIPLTLDDSVFADKKDKKNTTAIINLGFLQLAAHDFFNVNRCIDHEGNFPDFPLSPAGFLHRERVCDGGHSTRDAGDAGHFAGQVASRSRCPEAAVHHSSRAR